MHATTLITGQPDTALGFDSSSLASGTRVALADRTRSRLVATLATVCLCVGLILAEPVVLLGALVVLVACLLRNRLSWDIALPGAALLIVAAAGVAGTVGNLLGASVVPSRAVLAGLTLGFAAVAVRFARPVGAQLGPVGVRPGWLWDLLALAPAAVAVAIGLAQAVSTHAAALTGTAGTDIAQHMIGARLTAEAGVLNYAADAYPRAFHMLLALASPGAPTESGPALAHEMRVLVACSWLGFALVLLSAAAVTRRLAAAVGVSAAMGAVSAALVGIALLGTNSALGALVLMGAVPSLLAVVALWALAVAHLTERRSRWSPEQVLLAAAMTALLAHLWQALVVVPIVALAVAGLTTSRPSERRWTVAMTARAGVGVLVLAALALPPVAGIARSGGTANAGIPGDIPHPPWPLLVIGLVGVTLLPLLSRRWRPAAALAGTSLGLIVATGVLAYGAGSGLDLTQYYPMKALWFLTLILMPVTALVLSTSTVVATRWLGVQLDRLGRAARVGKMTASAVVVALGVSFVLPQLVVTPSISLQAVRPLWDASTAEQAVAKLDLAATYGRRFAPRRAVPVGVGSSAIFDRHGSYVVSKLISLQTGQPQNNGKPLFVCFEVAAVAGDAGAVVITKLPPDLLREIMRRDGCGHVPVVQVPGKIADSEALITLRRRG